jgi:hypothetical protein
MSLGSKLAQEEREQVSGSGPPTIYTDTIVGGDPSIILNSGVGSGFGMFQPQPTPYAHFIPYGFHNIANPGISGIPEYTFAPTPLLDQYAGGVGGRHRHGQVGGGSGDDGSLAGTVGVPVGHDGLSVRGGPSASAPTSAPARPFAAAASPPDGFGAGTGTGAGTGSGIQSGVVGGRGSGGTGVIRGLGHGTGTPSRNSNTVGTSASGNSTGYSGSNGGSGSANNVHPHSYNSNILISLPPRRQNRQHQLNPNQPTHQDHRQQSRRQDQNQHQYSHLGLPPNSHIGERDRTSISTTGSLLSYEMNQQPELEQADLSQQEAAPTEFTPQIEVRRLQGPSSCSIVTVSSLLGHLFLS